MKKFIISMLAVASLSAACTKFVEDTPLTYDSVAAPTVSLTVNADDSLTFSVVPAEGTFYYSYIVTEGPAKAIDPAKLIAGSYASSAVSDKAALLKFEDKSTVTEGVGGLTPYTEYTIYAVANTKMGVVSEMSVKTVRTTDETAPEISGYDYAEKDGVMVFAVEFTDPIELTGKGGAQVTFFAPYGANEDGTLAAFKAYSVNADDMAADANVFYVSVPKSQYIPGAIVALTFSDGVVKNAVGGENAEYRTCIVNAGGDGNRGLIARYETVTFNLTSDLVPESEEDEVEVVKFSDYEDFAVVLGSSLKYPMAIDSDVADFKITYTEPSGRTVSYSTTMLDENPEGTIVFGLDEAPAFGSTVSVVIAEESAYDIFGNTSAEFALEHAWFYSYGYSLEEAIGTFTLSGVQYDFSTNGYVEAQATSFVIAESDNAEKGNVMFTTYAGVPCQAGVYANFDVDAGTLTITEWQPFAAMEISGMQGYVYHSSYDQNDLVFNMLEPGVFSKNSDMFGLYFMGSEVEGWLQLFVDVKLTKVADPA